MKNTFCQNKNINIIAAFFMSTILLLGCQKSLNNEIELPTIIQIPADLTTKVTANTISGFVTDENEVAVKNAAVTVGTSTTTTDKYGYFDVKNTQVVKNAAVVTISKTGYFKGIKTFIAAENKSAFFRIKLIPKITAGTFNANVGGTVILPTGLSISFPTGAIVNAVSNVAYIGVVNVAAFYINPTGADINSIMPGDLRGLNNDGNLQLLTSFGMAAIELTSPSGDLLQIAVGKKAILTMPIATSLASTAPASIPLWYFNEANGLWKQEGAATKTGNAYVGEVSHFSFWNCDVPNNYIQFNCTVLNSAGQPLQNAVVKITIVGTTNAGYGYTDAQGYVGGAIPPNSQLLLEVFSSYTCGIAIYTQAFSSINANIALGNFTVSTATTTAVVMGVAINCTNLPVTNGAVFLQYGTRYYRANTNSTGAYTFGLLLCGASSASVTLVAEDYSTNQQSTTSNYTINIGNNSMPTIQACGVVSTNQFFNYTVNGTSYNYSTPVDSLTTSQGGTNNQISIYASGIQGTSGGPTLRFSSQNIANGSTQNLIQFYSPQVPNTATINTPINVNITDYGAIGAFISGNFTGVLTGPLPTNTLYNVTGNFRVRRSF